MTHVYTTSACKFPKRGVQGEGVTETIKGTVYRESQKIIDKIREPPHLDNSFLKNLMITFTTYLYMFFILYLCAQL